MPMFMLSVLNSSVIHKLKSSSQQNVLYTTTYNPRVHYHVHTSSPLVTVLSQTNAVHNFRSYFFMIHFNTTIPATPTSTSLFPPVYPTEPYMSLSSHPSPVSFSMVSTIDISKLNTIHIPSYYITCIDVCITNLLHNFILVVFAATCFGFESRPSSGSYKPFPRTQRIWQLVYK
jgi:hypothetical protein